MVTTMSRVDAVPERAESVPKMVENENVAVAEAVSGARWKIGAWHTPGPGSRAIEVEASADCGGS